MGFMAIEILDSGQTLYLKMPTSCCNIYSSNANSNVLNPMAIESTTLQSYESPILFKKWQGLVTQKFCSGLALASVLTALNALFRSGI